MDFIFDLHETQLNILEKYPEWQDIMNTVEFRNIPEISTAGHRGNVIYYNGRSLRYFPRETQAFILAEQLLHMQLAHRQRGKGRDPRIWSAACRAVVSELLIADGFEPPGNYLRFSQAKGLSAEDVYEMLIEMAEDGELEIPEEEASISELTDQTDTYAPELIRQKSDKHQPGGLQGAQDRDIEDPGLAHAVEGLSDLLEPSLQMDYDWFPADKIKDGILKDQFKAYPVPHAEILLDTSASIEEDLLRAFVRGVKGLMQEDAVVRVGCFDTEFYGFQEVQSEKDIAALEIKGAGGTNFETAVRAFTGDAETKIVFTDGYAEMPSTRCDAIWLVYSDTPVNPPGGRVIYVKKPEEIKDHEIDFLIT